MYSRLKNSPYIGDINSYFNPKKLDFASMAAQSAGHLFTIYSRPNKERPKEYEHAQ